MAEQIVDFLTHHLTIWDGEKSKPSVAEITQCRELLKKLKKAMNKSLDNTKKLNERVLLLEAGFATLEKENCSLNAGIATLEKEICSLNKSVDSLNANASKLRAFKARETLGEIVKRVYELIETEHEEEKISGYGNILARTANLTFPDVSFVNMTSLSAAACANAFFRIRVSD